jgi:hypothetical protein
MPLRIPCGVPPFALTDGGGGTIFAASGAALPLREPLEGTDGGGGTTSVAPKILPTKALMNDVPADCVGGGGITVFE